MRPDVFDRLEGFRSNEPVPRGEVHAAELEQIAAALLRGGFSESDSSVRWCRMMAADARQPQ
jgi:hypothetical protein